MAGKGKSKVFFTKYERSVNRFLYQAEMKANDTVPEYESYSVKKKASPERYHLANVWNETFHLEMNRLTREAGVRNL